MTPISLQLSHNPLSFHSNYIAIDLHAKSVTIHFVCLICVAHLGMKVVDDEFESHTSFLCIFYVCMCVCASEVKGVRHLKCADEHVYCAEIN